MGISTWKYLRKENGTSIALGCSFGSFSQKNRATVSQTSSPKSQLGPWASHLETESAISLPPTHKAHLWFGMPFWKARAVSGFRKGQSSQILKHRLMWKWPDSFAQYSFRDRLPWNVVWVMMHKTLGGPCLLGRQQSLSHSLLRITHLSPKAEKKPENNLDAG